MLCFDFSLYYCSQPVVQEVLVVYIKYCRRFLMTMFNIINNTNLNWKIWASSFHATQEFNICTQRFTNTYKQKHKNLMKFRAFKLLINIFKIERVFIYIYISIRSGCYLHCQLLPCSGSQRGLMVLCST